MVGNLLLNAIRHTPADGTVLVDGRRDGADRRLGGHGRVRRHPPDDLERVFDVAWRAAARTPGRATGGGLGLAIVRGLVEAHRGTVSVSNHGPGCRFLVRLPA